jgi:NADPH:quinone reductase-like Zn-dependent oxidoreductase
MPTNLDFDEAATTPTVCITVDSAFRQSAAVGPGDRVLVHAAAGGVGIAAMQLIVALGAETLATAGSSNKRALVRSLGPKDVLGSRDTMFASEAAQLGGASVALNSLTSSGMVAGSLAALGAGGRFVEISKRDIWSVARVAQGEIGVVSRGTCSSPLLPDFLQPIFSCFFLLSLWCRAP